MEIKRNHSSRSELRRDLSGAAKWRRGVADTYPGDDRNAVSIALLDRLVASVDDVRDETLEALEIKSLFRAMLRRVGFDWFPTSAQHAVEQYLAATKGLSPDDVKADYSRGSSHLVAYTRQIFDRMSARM
jgi:hypothetical protein